MERKKNCWEVMDCGKGPGSGGTPCPAAVETRLDGIHGGMNGGRACWVVVGTFCPDTQAQGTFARKMESCLVCPFYRQVRDGETAFRPHWDLLIRVR